MSRPWPVPVVSLTPVACGSATWRMRGVARVTVIVKATFGLAHEHSARLLAPAEIVREDRWREAPGSVDEASEVAPYLPGAGVVLRGSACAPGGIPTTGVTVRLAIFRDRWILDKTLHVFGDRAPQAAPRPFQKMPIVYERAYGGPAIEDNPVGVGAGEGARQLPNVVDPADPTRPAGFGPIPREWSARRRLVPRPQRSGLALAVPDVPEGFDWRYFQAAPRDQQIDALRGDEWIFLEGMHPDLPRVQSRLPSPRAAAMWFPETPGGLAPGRPIELVADTLSIDADRQTCSMIWRGSFVPGAQPVSSLKVFAGVELPGHPIVWPRPEDLAPQRQERQEVAPSFEPGGPDDPDATTMRMATKKRSVAAHAPSPVEVPAARGSQPIAAPPPSSKIPVVYEETEDDPSAGTRRLTVAELAASSQRPIAPFAISAPGERVPARAAIPGAPWKAAPLPKLGDDDAERTQGINLAALRASAALPFSSPPTGPMPRITPSEPPPRLGHGIEDESTVTASSMVPENVPAWLARAAESGPASFQPPPEPPAHIVSAPPAHIVSAPPAHIVSAPIAAAPPPAAPPATGLRADVLSRLRAGEPLRGLELAGADLRDLDLRGALLASCDLKGTNLARCNFEGARLGDARLVGADLTGANLARADLSRADLSRAVLADAKLDGATLTDANLSSARGPGASFQGATGQRVAFARGTWDGASFGAALLRSADFTGASLNGARFEGAQLVELRLEDATGAGAVFDGAKMPDAQAQGATLTASSFADADLSGSTWERATLSDSIFRGANLKGANLTRATCAKTSFVGADLQSANLQRITGDGADLTRANLEGADIRQARLQGAVFDQAMLKGLSGNKADLTRSSFARADLRAAVLRAAKLKGANLSRAELDGADLRDADLERANVAGANRKGARMNGANTREMIEEEP